MSDDKPVYAINAKYNNAPYLTMVISHNLNQLKLERRNISLRCDHRKCTTP